MNRGDPQNGWDTDQFPNDVREITLAMYYILRAGGFTMGGNNFDAKVRRQSIDAQDLLLAHIGGVDILARGLMNAAALIEHGGLADIVRQRYAGWDGPATQALLAPGATLADIADAAVLAGVDPRPRSGQQELLENLVSRFT
jgi:xylose isomerase